MEDILEFINNLIEYIDAYIKNNPYAGITLAALSIAANIVQLYEVGRQRRISKKEQAERDLLLKELKTYRYLFDKADLHAQVEQSLQGKQAELEEKDQKLETIQQAVLEKESELTGLESRLEQLVLTAQNELLHKEIEQRLSLVRQELADIENLKKEYSILDESLELPADVKEQLQNSLQQFLPEKPNELPKSFIFYAALLIAIVLLLPRPIDNFVLLVSLPLLFDLVIEVVNLLKNERLIRLFRKSYRLIVLASLFILWDGIFNWIGSILEPFALVLRETIYQYTNQLFTNSYYFYGFVEPYLVANLLSRGILAAIPIILTFMISVLHFPFVIRPVKARVKEMLPNLS